MTVEKVKNDPILGRVISENPHLFSKSSEYSSDQLCLLVLLIYENQKGEESFYWPYLDLMPKIDFFCFWEKENLFACQDLGLMLETKQYKIELEAEIFALCAIMRRYPDIFN